MKDKIKFMPTKLKVSVDNHHITERLKSLISTDDLLSYYITNAAHCGLRGEYLDENGNWMVTEPDIVLAVIEIPVFPVRKCGNDENTDCVIEK